MLDENGYAIQGFAAGLQDLQLADHQNAMLAEDADTYDLFSKTDAKWVVVSRNVRLSQLHAAPLDQYTTVPFFYFFFEKKSSDAILS